MLFSNIIFTNIQLEKEIDREIKPLHNLIIKATEDCIHPPSEIGSNVPQTSFLSDNQQNLIIGNKGTSSNKFKYYDRYKNSKSLMSEVSESTNEGHPIAQRIQTDLVSTDSTLVRVIVYVNDINDNPPQFYSKIFTGGVTTSTDFGTKFMSVQVTIFFLLFFYFIINQCFPKAADKDADDNAKLTYFQIGDIQRTLTEGLDNLNKPAFLVDNMTGEVQLNFDPQKGMKGYFDFMVLANDTGGLEDVAHVFIYLLREDQRVRFVLRQQPSQAREKIHMFRE